MPWIFIKCNECERITPVSTDIRKRGKLTNKEKKMCPYCIENGREEIKKKT